jgi:hypothetical protein
MRYAAVLAFVIGCGSLGCEESEPTRPLTPLTATITPTATPTATPTPLPCPNLSGSYDLAAGSTNLCSNPPIPIPFGTLVLQDQCSIRFFLRLDSGSVFGTVHGNTIDFRWNDGCNPDLLGTGEWRLRSDGRYDINGTVSRPSVEECCTSIIFRLTPRG